MEVAMTMTYGPAEVGGLVERGIFPESTREFVFDHGTIGNNHFVTIPYNSPNKEAAMVVYDIILSPEAQLEKADPLVWGDYPVIDISKTDIADQFQAIPVPESVLSPDELSKNSNPELVAEYVTATEAGWMENVLQQ
jgi:putative spermidine/putrescine transport system substrate-binding protein